MKLSAALGFIFTLFLINNLCFAQQSITLSGQVPISLTYTGSGTFNQTAIYNSIGNGFMIDLAKNSDNISGIPIDFKINARGGGHEFFIVNGTSGNVGVGTYSPQARLHVNYASSGQSVILASGADPSFRLVSRQDKIVNDDGAIVTELGLEYGTGRNTAIRFHRGSTVTGGFLSFTSDSGLERMRITTNGNIGIGTINPSQKLDVNGTIRTKEVNVTTSGWADYVFDPGYVLRPLSEVERFTQENGHLPNIPSEKEVIEFGVNLLEMNKKLLEKVEELTLYIIEQEKRIKALEEKKQ